MYITFYGYCHPRCVLFTLMGTMFRDICLGSICYTHSLLADAPISDIVCSADHMEFDSVYFGGSVQG